MGKKMSDSPCHTCKFKNEDKNSDRCINCEKRIKFAVDEGMLSKEVFEQGITIQELGMQEKKVIQEIKEVRQGIQPGRKRGPGRKHGRKPKEIFGDLTQAQVFLRFRDEYIKIYHDLIRIAEEEHRTISMQAMYFVKKGIDKYHKEVRNVDTD
jgi:hypothetical protein